MRSREARSLADVSKQSRFSFGLKEPLECRCLSGNNRRRRQLFEMLYGKLFIAYDTTQTQQA